jgi:putative SOS response-associated peptidase YedK
MKDREPFGLAGLWERWRPDSDAEPLETFTVITTGPSAVCAPIHNRMPAVIAPADFDTWLSAAPNSSALLRPYPAEPMEAYPVSRSVGNVKNEGLWLVEPLALPTTRAIILDKAL